MGPEHAGSEDALPRIGEHEVVVDAFRQLEIVVAERVTRLIEVSREGKGVARVFEPRVEVDTY